MEAARGSAAGRAGAGAPGTHAGRAGGYHPYVTKAYPQGRAWWGWRVAGGLRLVLLLCGLLAGGAVLRRLVLQAAQHEPQQVLVLDAGSSGTRMYAYNWSRPLHAGSLPLARAIPPSAAAALVPKHAAKGMYDRVETRPGLDAFVGDPAGLAAALRPLLAWARAVVPPHRAATTPLFLLGTGGLRRLEPHQREQLLDDARALLAQSGFRFEPGWAKAISGAEEGVFGWLALNYQQGRLRQRVPLPLPRGAGAAGAAGGSADSAAALAGMERTITSLGALDLGGSSLQVTFEVQPPSGGGAGAGPAAAPSSGLNVSVAGRTWHVHTHSFKRYGLNEAFDRAVTLLLEQQQAQQRLEGHMGKQEQVPQQLAQRPEPEQAQQEPVSGGDDGSAHAPEQQAPRVSAAPLPLPQQPVQTQQPQQRGEHGGDEGVVGISWPGEAHGHSQPGEQQQQQQGQQEQHRLPLPASSLPEAASLEELAAHDLAAAAAAGVQPGTEASAAAAAAALPQHPLVHEQQRQADLAAAAAAGLLVQPEQQADAPQDVGEARPNATVAAADAGSAARHAAAADATGATAGRSMHALAALAQAQAGPSGGRRLAAAAAVAGGRQRRQRRRALLHEQLQQLLGLSEGPASQSGAPGLEQATQQGHRRRLRQLLQEYLAAPGDSSSSTSLRGGSAASDAPGAGKASSIAQPALAEAAGSSGSKAGAGVPVGSHGQDAPGAAPAGAGSSNASMPPLVLHPCLHGGYAARYERTAYDGIAPEPPAVLLVGRPDWEACLDLADAVVNASAPCSTAAAPAAGPDARGTVCMLGSQQPEAQGSFMALTGFYVVSRFLGVPPDARSLEPLLSAARALCARPWADVRAALGQHVNVERYCTWGPYVVRLLLSGLGLEERQLVLAAEGDVGWPLGAALAEASRLAAFAAPPPRGGGGLGRRGGNGGGGGGHAPPPAGAAAQRAWRYSQRRSWAQALLGSRHELRLGHVTLVFAAVTVWLSLVVWWRRPRASLGSGGGLVKLPVSLQQGLYGAPPPGKAQAHLGGARLGGGKASPVLPRGLRLGGK